MNREELILMAQEAVIGSPNENPFDFRLLQIETIERFAALVAAAEREACAELCEATYEGAFEGVRPCFDTPQECAAAIRARGEK